MPKFVNGGEQPLVLVIVGPTASGKSALAIKIAKKHNGEIISADSRAIYKYVDIKDYLYTISYAYAFYAKKEPNAFFSLLHEQ